MLHPLKDAMGLRVETANWLDTRIIIVGGNESPCDLHDCTYDAKRNRRDNLQANAKLLLSVPAR